MKNMNNKGFAISTFLYGLSILIVLVVFVLLGILGTTRKNTRNLVKSIEEELNRFESINVSGEYNPDIDGGEDGRRYIAKEAGWYKIELWGSKIPYGPSRQYSYDGDYLSGIIYLHKNAHIYTHLGSENVADIQKHSTYVNFSEDEDKYTIMRTGRTELGDTNAPYEINDEKFNSYEDIDIPLAFGYAGSIVNEQYDTSKKFTDIHLGDYDENGNAIITEYTPTIYNVIDIPKVNPNVSKYSITKISDNDEDNNPVTRVNNERFKNIRYIRDCITESDQESDKLHWTEIQAIDTTGNNVAKNKRAAIVLPDNHDVTIYDYENIERVNDGKLYDYVTINKNATSSTCIEIDLGKQYDLNEIAVWHNYYKNDILERQGYKKHTIQIADENHSYNEFNTIRQITDNTVEKETKKGIRYSVYQPMQSPGSSLEDGKYYILEGSSINKNYALTIEGEKATLKTFNGSKDQEWYLEKESNKYILTSVSTGKKLSIINSDNGLKVDSTVTNNNKFSITPKNAGYFKLCNSDPYSGINYCMYKDNTNLKYGYVANDSMAKFNLIKTY